MRKGDATRARILETAAREAAQKGLGAVSLGELAGAVGLSKSGLFKHFESKEAMQQAVVEQITARFADFVWAPAIDLAPGRARLEKVFRRWLDWAELEWPASGCPMVTFSIELDDQPGPLRDYLQGQLRRWRRTLMREFAAIRTPPLDEDQAELCYFEMKSLVLGHTEARRMMGDMDARGLAERAFAGLLKRAEIGAV
ncbi:TetR/AcrR family transcriptional regulator [Phenylobacterium soli]|uniref:TetR/AcrR family transcriptional regulator n=1 Tax=Phenylobacterium soli TaxID=2170551 RepID=UPI00140280D4|nr:TetR/AcrR family transcriptional regulator [Phenylobacterium soli]